MTVPTVAWLLRLSLFPLAQILADESEVGFAVDDGEEHLLTIRAPLGDVIRNSRSDHSRVSVHLPEQVQSGRQNPHWGRA
jgi:hypothetical protein